MDDNWKQVQQAWKALADTLEAQGDTTTMSDCWAPINMIDHDRDSLDLARRLKAITRAVLAINDKLTTNQKSGEVIT